MAGVDLDAGMLATGQRKAPEIDFRVADLEIVALGRTFEAILMAGNVMIFLTPGSEGRVLKNLARHLTPGGFVIAGFQLRPGGLDVERYDTLTADAGLVLYERFATWDGDPWRPGGNYAVSVHRSAGR